MTAKFNNHGASGLLLKTLPLDECLDILLESKNNKVKNDFLSNKRNNNDINSYLKYDLNYIDDDLNINKIQNYNSGNFKGFDKKLNKIIKIKIIIFMLD